MSISDWSSDVCSSDLDVGAGIQPGGDAQGVAGELLGQLERLELRLGQRGELVAGQHARLVVRRVGLAEQERPVALVELVERAAVHAQGDADAAGGDLLVPVQFRARSEAVELRRGLLDFELHGVAPEWKGAGGRDRKSTRLNSSH